jgi:uncharacterized protein
VNFEWDEAKNRENIRKHGLSFADAAEVFRAPLLAALDAREAYGEARFVGVGLLRNFNVVIVYTEPDEDTVRVISLRKALKHERERFEAAIRDGLGEG